MKKLFFFLLLLWQLSLFGQPPRVRGRIQTYYAGGIEYSGIILYSYECPNTVNITFHYGAECNQLWDMGFATSDHKKQVQMVKSFARRHGSVVRDSSYCTVLYCAMALLDSSTTQNQALALLATKPVETVGAATPQMLQLLKESGHPHCAINLLSPYLGSFDYVKAINKMMAVYWASAK